MLQLASTNAAYTAATVVNGGTLQNGLDNALPTGTALTVNAGGTYDINSFNQTLSAAISGSGNIVDNGAASSLTLSNTNAAGYSVTPLLTSSNLSLIKSGTGIVTLSHADTYGGSTTVNAGSLADGVDNALPTGTLLTVNGGTFDLNSHNQTLSTVINGSGTITDSGTASTLTLNNPGTYTLTPLLTGTHLSLTLSGTGAVTLNQVNTYGGTTTISAGTLLDGVDNALPTLSALTVSGSGTYDLNSHNQTLAGPILGSGTITDSGSSSTLTISNSASFTMGPLLTGVNLSLTQAGPGTLTLAGTNTYGGTTTINGGTLSIGRR